MNEKMTLLLVKETGHIVAALTRAADPEAALKTDLLAGEALLVRYFGNITADGYGATEFLVQPDQLDVLITDLDAGVVSNPRGFFVDASKEARPLNLVAAVSVTSPLASNAQIVITAAPTEKAKVWIQVVGPPPAIPQVATEEIPADGPNVTVDIRPLDQPATDYHVLVLVAGLQPRTLIVTTP
jgi:hypothetical protein